MLLPVLEELLQSPLQGGAAPKLLQSLPILQELLRSPLQDAFAEVSRYRYLQALPTVIKILQVLLLDTRRSSTLAHHWSQKVPAKTCMNTSHDDPLQSA